MKKIIALVFAIIFIVIGIYTLIDIIRSVWYVLVYESITTSASGILFGKFLFLVIIFIGYLFTLKLYKKSKK